MSWTDQIQTELIITTGDGKQYKPLWMPSTKSVQYNIAEFEFPEVSGTLIKKGKPKGRKFDMEIYFQGDDFLDVSKAFEISANDERPWVILHPYYGSITVHPSGLNFNNSQYNTAKITGELLETITEDKPKTSIDPVDNIRLEKENLDAEFVEAFDITPSTSDINLITEKNNKFFTICSKISSVAEESEKFLNLFNTANAAVLNATALPLDAIRAVHAFINAPSLFTANVKSRIGVLSSEFNSLSEDVVNISDKSEKKIYENYAATILSCNALAAANPIIGDYKNMNSVLLIIEILIDDYNQYLYDLDSLQTENGGDPESYIPDADSIIALGSLMNLTISNLFKIALKSKRERSIILEEDSNWVLLTHRFYGLDILDNNLIELMDNNEVGLNEILQVRKGRKIIYYV
jgi:hypothetical protein